MSNEVNTAALTPILPPAIEANTSGSSAPMAGRFESFITAEEAAQLLTLHPVTLLRWGREGRVPHHRLGRRVVFRLSELEKWLSSGQPSEDRRAAA